MAGRRIVPRTCLAWNRAVATAISFRSGDNVRFKNYAGKVGKIVEYRGTLGPGGAPVYRVQVKRKPNISCIELLGNQNEVIAPAHKEPAHVVGKARKSS